MPKPIHDRWTVSGVFRPSASVILEEWSWSLSTAGNTFATVADMQNAANEFQRLYGLHIKSIHRAPIVATNFRVASIGANGRVGVNGDGAFVQADNKVEVVGTNGGTGTLPPQVACAVSLQTPRSGASGKGRLFLPTPGYTLSANNMGLLAADAVSIANGVRDLIAGINTYLAAFSTQKVSVVSSKGFSSPVRTVKVGVTLDTQRRRRGDMLESYQAVAVP